jgi:uncharacterized protein YdcH (DUF465 family)
MSHELPEEFPERVTLIRHLRETDGHFCMIGMRKSRMRLKDEILEMRMRAERALESPQPG